MSKEGSKGHFHRLGTGVEALFGVISSKTNVNNTGSIILYFTLKAQI